MSANLMRDGEKVAAQKIIFGTMRLNEVERSIAEWVCFFQSIYERGITTIHSSSEYDSFPLLREILNQLRQDSPAVDFRHIVKLADPSFDDSEFSPERLGQTINLYRQALGADHIEDIQWMWRHDLRDDVRRQREFRRTALTISESVSHLKDSRRIGRFLCFPYSSAFADCALDVDAIDGIVVYRNTLELEYDAAIERAHSMGKAAIIIRPFAAGKNLADANKTALGQLKFALTKPGIESAILSSNNLAHIDQLVEC